MRAEHHLLAPKASEECMPSYLGFQKYNEKNMHEQNWECNLFIEMRHDILEMLLTIQRCGMDMHAYLQLAIMLGI